MTTSPTDPDSPATIPQSPTRKAAECEAGLRRVLAYICAKRYRRLFAGIVVFLLLFQAIGTLTSMPLTFVIPLLPILVGESLFETIYGSPVILGLWTLVINLLVPLIITVIIFSRLRRIYRGY